MYRDRLHAGQVLASAAREIPDEGEVLVLGIPRGGVIVAREVAAGLHAPLDVVMAKKIASPFDPEFALAAVDQDGAVVTWPGARLPTLEGYIDNQAKTAAESMCGVIRLYRNNRPPQDISRKTVFIVDDGLATGLTALAAIHYVKRRGARKVVLAVPVSLPETIQLLEPEVDTVLCPLRPTNFQAVGEWYQRFDQVSDSEVIAALQRVEG